LVAEASTLRCHLEADHYNKYHQWAKKQEFTLALSGDKKRAVAVVAANIVSQPTLDTSFQEIAAREVIIPYSHAVFCEAATE
ncbi:hypothetical protein K438DRAFT_1705701, partial [Mycena galopus ATCC 62051]